MKKHFKQICSLLLCACMCICMCGCETWNNFRKAFIDPPQEKEKTIKIGVFEPLTGRQSYDAEDEIAGIELAHDMFPEALGYKIELIYEDNRSNTEICVTAAQTLIAKGCSAIIGSVSDTLSLAASDTIKEGQIPTVSATNTVPILTQTNPYYFRANYINTFDAEGAAKYAVENLKADRCAILLSKNNDFEKGKAEQYENDVIEMVGNAEFEIETTIYDEDSGDYNTVTVNRPTVKYVYITGEETPTQINSILTSLDREGYYTIFCPAPSESALPFIDASKHYEFIEETQPEESEQPEEENNDEEHEWWWEEPVEVTTPQQSANDSVIEKRFNWIGTERWMGIEKTASEMLGTNACLIDVFYTIDYDPAAKQSDTAAAFLAAYKEKYQTEELPSDAVALGYDAYLIVYNAILACGTDEEGNILSFEERSTLLFDENDMFKRQLIADQIYLLRDMIGSTGTLSINEYGDPVKDIYIRQFDGVEFKVIYSVRPIN